MMVMGFVACTTGGYTPPPGSQCGINYNPSNFDYEASLKVQSITKLPPGTYSFNHVDLYYQENSNSGRAGAAESPLVIDISGGLGVAGQMTAQGIGCVRNAEYGMTGYNANAQMITDISVDLQGNQTATVRNFGFSYDNLGIHVVTPTALMATTSADPTLLPQANSTYAKPIPSYGDGYVMLQLDPNNYEMRVRYTGTDGKGDIRSSVHMSYSAATAATPPPATFPTIPCSAAYAITMLGMMTVPSTQLVQAKDLPAGSYTFARAEVYYQEDITLTARPLAGPNPVVIDVNSTAPTVAGQPTTQGIYCVSNVTAGLTGYSANAFGVTDVTIDGQKNMSVTVRNFGFNYPATTSGSSSFQNVTPAAILPNLTSMDLSTFTPPTGSGVLKQTLIIKIPNTPTYEIRSQFGSNDGKGNFWMLVDMNFTPAAVAAKN
jgi:hypothetical protein